MQPFKNVMNAHPGRNKFDLSYQKLFSCDMGEMIPVLHDEVIPGDKWTIGNEIVIRFQPLVAPILHPINCITEYFFVPYRLLWEDWENFITGGDDGMDDSILPEWNPTAADEDYGLGTLWDHFGMPPNMDPGIGYRPLDFMRRAYVLVWNEFYRDENLQLPIDITDQTLVTENQIFNSAWEKDYFTSALLSQQKGISPSLPISGTTSAAWADPLAVPINVSGVSPHLAWNNTADPPVMLNIITSGVNQGEYADNAGLNSNIVDLSSATTFNVADLRLVFQIQKFLERNNRCGSRYTEWLKGHFNVTNGDARLQRPEFVGGSVSPVIVSEVLQTSETATTPQGTMAGHGISVSSQFCGHYFASEYGIMLGIMRVMPKPMYSQGINRQWLRQSKYDFPIPEFVNLSEQAITQEEIYAVSGSGNGTIFGYQGRYDECRYKPNMVTGLMRPDATDNLGFWHLSRLFGSAPVLNESFIKCVPDKRVFAVEDQPGLIVAFGNLIHAIRPLPTMGTPGLIDHN
jgi:hypothetical protein